MLPKEVYCNITGGSHEYFNTTQQRGMWIEDNCYFAKERATKVKCVFLYVRTNTKEQNARGIPNSVDGLFVNRINLL